MKRITALLLVALPVLAQVRGGGSGGMRGGAGAGVHPGTSFGGAGRGSGFVGNTGRITSQNFPIPAAAGNTAGFGSVVFPGGVPGFGSVVNPIYSNNQSFAGRLGNVVSGVPPLMVAPGPLGTSGSGFIGRGRAAVYPVPVFIGGYGYGPTYANGYYNNGYQDPQVTIINQQPPVIINQNYVPDQPARPAMQVYGNGPDSVVNTIQVASPSYPEGRPLSVAAVDGDDASSNPSDEPTIYLIALKDGTIYASYAFWAEHDTLHYITPGHAHNQISLDRIDLALSRRLNKDRKLDFSLR